MSSNIEESKTPPTWSDCSKEITKECYGTVGDFLKVCRSIETDLDLIEANNDLMDKYKKGNYMKGGISKGFIQLRNSQDPSKITDCVLYQTREKAMNCQPCVCQIICKLDPKLCRHCHTLR